jgi:hypothetical protein
MKIVTSERGLTLLVPEWDVPSHVQAIISTRHGGVSKAPFDSLNLGDHVGDDSRDVLINRSLIREELVSDPIWLKQVHGTQIWDDQQTSMEADGAVTNRANQTLSIMTADCMPILICDAQGETLGACHGGWRGLALGVIEQTIQHMVKKQKPDQPNQYQSQMKVYLGPTIGPLHFEVSQDVMQAFVKILPMTAIKDSFKPSQVPEKYVVNLFKIAKYQLMRLDIEQIYSEEICCYSQEDLFFSHRRDKQTGRFASFLWKSDISLK